MEIESRREPQKGQNLLLKKRKRRHMPLHEARGTNDRQGYVAERFQQAFGGRLTRATFGIPSKQTSQLPLLLMQTVSDHAFQQGHDAQSDGEQAHQSHSMVIALHIQRGQRQGMTFETRE